jgi:hypothetical protein
MTLTWRGASPAQGWKLNLAARLDEPDLAVYKRKRRRALGNEALGTSARRGAFAANFP